VTSLIFRRGCARHHTTLLTASEKSNTDSNMKKTIHGGRAGGSTRGIPFRSVARHAKPLVNSRNTNRTSSKVGSLQELQTESSTSSPFVGTFSFIQFFKPWNNEKSHRLRPGERVDDQPISCFRRSTEKVDRLPMQGT
jgi:hypothetical protein